MSYEETIKTIKVNFQVHFFKKPSLYGMKATIHLTLYSLCVAFWYGIRGKFPWKDARYSLANDNLYKIIFCEAFARLLMKKY